MTTTKYSWNEFKNLPTYTSPGIDEKKITENYKQAQTLALNSFNAKYFKDGDKKKSKKELTELSNVVSLFKSNVIQEGIDGMIEEYNAISDKGYRGMDKLLVAATQSKDDKKAVDKILSDLSKKSQELNQTLQYTLPMWVAKEILGMDEKKDDPSKMINAALSDIRGGSVASETSLKRLDLIYKKLETLTSDADVKKEFLNSGRILATNAEKGMSEEAIKAMKKEKQYWEKAYEKTKTSKGKETFKFGQSLAGYYTSVFGTVYEMMVKEAIKRGLGEAAKVAVVGGDTGADGRSKTDVRLNVNGKDLLIKLNQQNLIPNNIQFNDSINAEFSVKSNKMSAKTTLLQTTLTSYIGMVGSDSYTRLLEHYFKMAASVDKSTEKDATVDLINRYIASKNITKIIGEGIDFITFGDKTVTKYEYIATYIKKDFKKQVRAIDKSGRKINPEKFDETIYYPSGAIKILLDNRW